MCLAVYVASSKPLPTSAWQKDARAFYLEAVAAHESVRKQFAAANVYYAGSHKGCGCGFIKDGEVGEDLAACQRNYDALSLVVARAMADGAAVEIFSCWEGDQTKPPEFVESLAPQALAEPGFELKERQLLRICANEA
jgi:hypothetical protein